MPGPQSLPHGNVKKMERKEGRWKENIKEDKRSK